MRRSMMQAYVKRSDLAVALYQKAFGAELVSGYPNEDGTYYHSELDVYGQILAVAEAGGMYPGRQENGISGDTMQFCLHFEEGEEDKLRRAYDALKEGAEILYPLGPCPFSRLMADLIDPFGVRWCLLL